MQNGHQDQERSRATSTISTRCQRSFPRFAYSRSDWFWTSWPLESSSSPIEQRTDLLTFESTLARVQGSRRGQAVEAAPRTPRSALITFQQAPLAMPLVASTVGAIRPSISSDLTYISPPSESAARQTERIRDGAFCELHARKAPGEINCSPEAFELAFAASA